MKGLSGIAAMLVIALSASISTAYEWESSHELLTVAHGGELMITQPSLDSKLIADGDAIKKQIESTLEASGVKELQMVTSAYLETNIDGHTYTYEPKLFTFLKTPIDTDVSINQFIDSNVILTNPDMPNFIRDTTAEVDNVENMVIGKYGKLSEINELSVLDDFTLGLYELSKLQGDEFDSAVKNWFKNFCGIEFGNIGIDYEGGYSIPLSDSHNGVTCRWDESEKVGLKM